jgi:glycosyltransferase involved in cell wall biosynthesis
VSKGVQETFPIAGQLVPGRSRVIYNGIEISRIDDIAGEVDPIRKRRQLGLEPDSWLIGNVARLSYEKNQTCLIDAMRIVATKRPKAKLVIVGWGPLEGQLRSSVERLGLQDSVLFLGHLPSHEVYELLGSIDVFALSSIYEGFNLAILEAMACGRPIVSTNVTGVQEAVVDGRTGTLVPPSNPEALAQAIVDLLDHPDRAHDMGIAGRARMERHFSSSVMAKQYEQLYQDLIRQKGLSFANT